MEKLNKSAICEILGIKKDALKTIETRNNNLDKRLEQKGYKLIEKLKEGRNVYYVLEKTSTKKEVFSNVLKYCFNITKEDEFAEYFIDRTNDGIISASDLAKKIKVHANTIMSWDDTLIDNQILTKDGYTYYCVEKNEGMRECSMEEYKNFWKNKSLTNAYRTLQMRYIKGELTLNEFTLAISGLSSIVTTIEGKNYFRVKKYQTNVENQLYQDTKNLIEDLY